MYYLYMIKNDFGKLYIGITESLKNRLFYHNSKMGSEFTKGKAKFHLVFSEEYKTLNPDQQLLVGVIFFTSLIGLRAQPHREYSPHLRRKPCRLLGLNLYQFRDRACR